MSSSPRRNRRPTTEIFLALGVISAIAAAAWLGLDPVFSALEWLETEVDQNLGAALAWFTLAFVVLSLTTLPVVTVFCLASGYLFGPITGTFFALLAGTTGATLTFAVVRAVGGRRFRARLPQGRTQSWMALLERDVTWYLIVLRIVPVAPFFLINAAAGLTGISLLHFISVTVVGLLPLTLIYVSVGNGLETLTDSRDLLGPGLLLQPQIMLPLLALLALVGAAR
ncbi:MAG: VTT domain-containing protein, partial [Wenzhouxiangella sp.]|nr:VTT domain-containing protein [Wenzhouxiangella sp.]